LNKPFHLSAIVLAVLAPAAFVSPSSFSQPIDLSLGVIFPFHAHVAMNYIVSDYVPHAFRTLARSGVLGLTVLSVAGLLKLNLSGDGLTQTIKCLWKKSEKK
jgi:succinate dehydrogenase (ubiquinone) membrane anchor subunit